MSEPLDLTGTEIRYLIGAARRRIKEIPDDFEYAEYDRAILETAAAKLDRHYLSRFDPTFVAA